MDLHAATLYEAIADEQPDALALAHGDVRRTWREFDDRAARLAAGFVAAGLTVGSRIAIDLYNSNEFLEAFFAALKVRCLPVAINYRYLDDELWYLLDNCRAEAVLYHASMAERVRRVVPRLDTIRLLVEVDTASDAPRHEAVAPYEELLAANDPAPRIERSIDDQMLAYTGGTTGLPKGVQARVGPAGAFLQSIAGLTLGFPGQPPDDVVVARRLLREIASVPVGIPASPMMHSTAMAMLAVPILAMGGAVVTLAGRSFDAHELVDTIELRRATNVSVVGDAIARPLLYALDERAAAGRPVDTSSLRGMCSAGVQFSGEVKERLVEHVRGLVIVDACGSTDGAWYGTNYTRYGDRGYTSRFQLAPGVVLLDEHDEVIAPGSDQVGLLASPSANQDGYLGDPVKSAETWRDIDGQRYVMPGDYGRLHNDGTFTLVGRGSATINSGGEKIYPEEVEEVIKELAGIDDCLVLGLPDERWMQRVVALAQRAANHDVTEADVIGHTHARLAAYKSPKQVVFVDAIPRFPNGKPDYAAGQELARTYAQRSIITLH